MVRKLMTAFHILRLRGLGYLSYLFKGYWVPRLFYELFQRFHPPRLIRQRLQHIDLAEARARLKTVPGAQFARWDIWPASSSVRQAVEAYLRDRPNEEVVLGQVDNDGRLLGNFGQLPDWVPVSPGDFVTRHRFPLDLVLKDGFVLIRKNFRGNRVRFSREWYNLARLAQQANVPAVYKVDENRTLLYKNMVVGRTVRDILVEAGVPILNVQTESDPSLASLPASERLQAILARGTKHLSACLPNAFFQELEQQVDAIHREGVAGLSLTFGNVMVDADGHPWLIDLEGAEAYPSTIHPFFRWLRDQDREKFNRIYAQNALTERKARRKLSELVFGERGWYAPIDFGGGLTVNGFWTVDSGTGRWEFLNRRVLTPLLRDKRILDLGSNNGLMPIMMLKDGAREVVGLELDAQMIERARVVHEIFEWRDMRNYSFTVYNKDMRAVLDHDWGPFDVVTAFCSLYYLPEKDMARVMRRVSELAPVMVLQAKTDTRPEAEANKAEKSSLPFLKDLLETNGFPHVEIHAPKGFTRPLLVGRK